MSGVEDEGLPGKTDTYIASEATPIELGTLTSQIDSAWILAKDLASWDGLAEVVGTYLGRKVPSLENARDSLECSLRLTDLAQDPQKDPVARTRDEFTSWGLNTAALTFMKGFEEPLAHLESDAIKSRLPGALAVAQDINFRLSTANAIATEHPEFGYVFYGLRTESYKAAGLEIIPDEKKKLSHSQKIKISSFQQGAFTLYFAVAGAVGVLDIPKAGPEELVLNSAIAWNEDHQPDEKDLVGLLKSPPGQIGASFKSAYSHTWREGFDPETEFGDTQLLLKTYDRLKDINYAHTEDMETDYKGITIRIDGDTRAVLRSAFTDGCAAILNGLHNSGAQKLKWALQSTNNKLFLEGLENAYDEAKAIIIDEKKLGSVPRSLNQFPLLSEMYSSFYTWVKTARTSGGWDYNRYASSLQGGLSVLMLLASYADRLEPNKQQFHFQQSIDESLGVVEDPRSIVEAKSNPVVPLKEPNLGETPETYGEVLINALTEGELKLRRWRSLGAACLKIYRVKKMAKVIQNEAEHITKKNMKLSRPLI